MHCTATANSAGRDSFRNSSDMLLNTKVISVGDY
jgi:hypothetical protein